MGQNDGLNAWCGIDQLELYKSFIMFFMIVFFDEFLKWYLLIWKVMLKLWNFYMLMIYLLIVLGNILIEWDEVVLLGIFNWVMVELLFGLICFDMMLNFYQVVILMRLYFVVQFQKVRKGWMFDVFIWIWQDVYNYEVGNVQLVWCFFFQIFGIFGGC